MRRRALPAALLALTLLTGCSGFPGGTGGSVPTAAPGPNVTVHWDALSGREPNAPTAKRRSPDWMGELVPAGDYGPLVPYIGGEHQVRYDGETGTGVHYETEYLYGLCTLNGTLITDPVYTSAWALNWYDRENETSHTLPVWTLRQTLPDHDAYDGYSNRMGLAAADGSWSTGVKYLADEIGGLCANNRSALMLEDPETAVLLSLADGSEIARYTPWDFLSPDADPDSAHWFFSSTMGWGGLWCLKDWFYFDPAESGHSGPPAWIDAATGKILTDPPREAPRYGEGNYRILFDGGWYEYTGPVGDLVLHYDDGRTETIALDGRYGELASASTRHLLFSDNHGGPDGDGVYRTDYTLTDHALNMLAAYPDGNLYLYTDETGGRQWPVAMEVLDPDNYLYRYTLLNDNGAPLTVSRCYPEVNRGLAAVVDDTAYRLLDLENGAKELFRLPRWAALDTPADRDPAEDGARYFFAEGLFLGSWSKENGWRSASSGGFTLGQLFDRSYVDWQGQSVGAVRFYAGEGPGSLDDPETARALLSPYGVLEGSDFVMKLPGKLGGAAAELPAPTWGFYATFDGNYYHFISNEAVDQPQFRSTDGLLDDGAVQSLLWDWGVYCDLNRTQRAAWLVDLDGDGVQEHVELIQTRRDADTGWLILELMDPVFYALLVTDGDGTAVVTLEREDYTTDPTAWFSPGDAISSAPIFADLDGDGMCEIILQHACWEWGHYAAFTATDGWWHEVLRADYGT